MNTNLQSRNFKLLFFALLAGLFTMGNMVNVVKAEDAPKTEENKKEDTKKEDTKKEKSDAEKGGWDWWVWALIIGGIVLVIGLGYYFLVYKKEEETA